MLDWLRCLNGIPVSAESEALSDSKTSVQLMFTQVQKSLCPNIVQQYWQLTNGKCSKYNDLKQASMLDPISIKAHNKHMQLTL